MSYDQIGDISAFPWLRPSRFLDAMLRSNDIHRLLGGYSLEESQQTLKLFWSRYQQQFPDHQVFQDPIKAANPGCCLPLYIHGDEGTTYKRKGVLIIAWQSAIGTGSRHAPNERPSEPPGRLNEAGIPLNLLQTALQTRFVTAVCPKDTWGVPARFLSFFY